MCAEIKKMVLGIDIGGTDTKFGVILEDSLLYQSKIPSNKESVEGILTEICEECKRIQKDYPFERIGIGVPGVVYDGLLTTINLPFDRTPIAEEIEKRLGLPVAVDNDANCAALGEAVCGKGKDYRNVIMVTLGTGVGGGVVVDGNILRGRGGAGELGHIIIQSVDGLPCNCGQFGCWEQYASASALVRQAEAAAKGKPDSLLGKLLKQEGSLNGLLIFKALEQGCPVAETVFDTYLNWLCVGLKSLKMIFDPEIILLAGGITKQGDVLLKPLMEKLGGCVLVEVAKLQNDAGVFGAAHL